MGSEILNKAIEFEKEGIEFYSKALKIIKHELCRGVIQSLLDEEKKHIEELRNIYNELKEKGIWPEKETVLTSSKLKNIFESAGNNLSKTIRPSSDEKKFLDLCLDLEIKGKKIYKDLADEAVDAKEKQFYIMLSNEEEKHYQFLEQYYNYYWDSGLRMQE